MIWMSVLSYTTTHLPAGCGLLTAVLSADALLMGSGMLFWRQ
jgi:hypothetical protein